MADDRIEVEIVLDDGSIQKGFARIRAEGDKTEKSLAKNFTRALRADISKPFDVAKKSVFNLRNAVVGLTAVIGGGAFLRAVTQAAAEQEAAVNALNVSLKTAGTFSQEASENFQELARSLQANSRFGDEILLQQAALARNFTRSNEEAEKLLKTSVDLSEATGISLDSAVRNLGKTLSGLTGELGEAVPQIRGLTAEQLKAGEAINVLAERFGGAARGALFTFEGAVAQLSNTFGDFLERVGSIITDSPQVIAFINALSETFQTLGSDFGDAQSSFDTFFKNLVIGAGAAANALLDSFSVILEIPKFIEFLFLETKKIVLDSILVIVDQLDNVAAGISAVTGANLDLRRTLISLRNETAKTEVQLGELSKSSIEGNSTLDFLRNTITKAIDRFIELGSVSREAGNSLKNSLAEAPVAVDQATERIRQSVLKLQQDTRETLQETFFNPEDAQFDRSIFESVADKSKEELTDLQKKLTETRNKFIQESQAINQAVRNGVANGIANSVAAVVNALQAGENAFEAFGKAALATIGDLAVQLGQTLILSGIGIEALKTLGGAAAIAAGIGLVAVGTLLKSFSGGAASNPSGGSAVTPPLADLEPDGISDEINDSARVNVTIEGNVFDGDETGLRIADILKDQGFNNAVVS